MSLLGQIQKQIEEIYNYPSEVSVEDYLIPATTLRGHIAVQDLSEIQEILLVEEGEIDLKIGLYVGPDILDLLTRHPPFERLTQENLESFCTAIEGVSHFLFLAARFRERRPVSHLELELQAEVDKFLLCTLTLERQKENLARRLLPSILFDGYHLLAHLSLREQERYHLANRLAFRYCQKLQRMSHPLLRPRLIREARKFRSRGLQEKIHLLTNPSRRVNLAG